jgi:hypothetical protein
MYHYDMSGNDREVTRVSIALNSMKRKSEECDGNLHKRRKENNSKMLSNKEIFRSEIDDDDIDETLMTPRLGRRFEDLFGDSQPTSSMVRKNTLDASKRLEKKGQEMKQLKSSASVHLTMNAKMSQKTGGETVKPTTPRLKRKFELLFEDDSDKPTMKKTKLDVVGTKALAAAEEITFLKAFESGQWHDKTQLAKLTNLPMKSIDRLAKKHCRRVVPHSRKSKGKPDLRLQLIEEEEKAAAVSVRKASSKEAIVMRQRHQQRLKVLKVDGNESKEDKKNEIISVILKRQAQLESRKEIASNSPVQWKIPRIADADNSTTSVWINETISPLEQIDQLPKKLLGWRIPRKPRIDSGDDWSKYG